MGNKLLNRHLQSGSRDKRLTAAALGGLRRCRHVIFRFVQNVTRFRFRKKVIRHFRSERHIGHQGSVSDVTGAPRIRRPG